MRIIIDIPEETYKGIMLGKWDKNGLAYYVKVGTPLPKGHGKLKDVDWIEDNCQWHYSDENGILCYAVKDIDEAPTIIEKDI